MSLALGMLLGTALLSAGGSSSAWVQAGTNSSLVMLRVSKTRTARAYEERLWAQLGLVLDGFETFQVVPAEAEFAEQSLGTQIELVRPIADQYQASAVVWLTESAPDVVLLQLVATGTGRVLARTIEARASARSDRDLALAVRELLGTAYLFEPERAAEAVAVRAVVDSVRSQLAPPEPSAPAPAPERRGFLRAGGAVTGGVLGQHGSSFLGGGQVALEFDALPWAGLGLSLGAASTPRHRLEGAWAAAWSASLHALAYASWRLGPLELGPQVELGLTTRYSSVTLDDGTWQQSLRFDPQYGVGARAAAHLSRSLAALVTAVFLAAPRHEEYRRRANSMLLFATPWLRWQLDVALRLRLPF